MEVAGIVDLVLLVVVIVYVYPFAKTQLRKVLGKSALTTLGAVGVSVAALKYGTQFSNDFLKESGKKGKKGKKKVVREGTTFGRSAPERTFENQDHCGGKVC